MVRKVLFQDRNNGDCG